MSDPNWKNKMRASVGSCPKCGKSGENLWFNDVPLTAFCWGEEGKEHAECSRVVPDPFQMYGEVGNTEWQEDDE